MPLLARIVVTALFVALVAVPVIRRLRRHR
jgi:hypothetical protein